MRYAYRVAAVRAAEEELMRTVAEPELMTVAAAGLARVAAGALVGGVAGARVVALVGSGNNGGDVLFAVADLAGRGAAVSAITVADSSHAAGVAAVRAAGGHVVSATDSAAATITSEADLVLDGIVGIGASGPLRSPAAELVQVAAGAVVVAADVPSGVDPNTGAVADAERVVTADVTVTFGCLKSGLLLDPGRWRVGTVEVVDIGLEPALAQQPTDVAVLDPIDVRRWFAPLSPADYKYSHGVLAAAAGSAQYPGAAHMVVGAARHSGVGMVRLHSSPQSLAAAEAVVHRFPDVVITTDEPQQDPRATGWVIGPGLGTDSAAAQLLADVLDTDLPVVVDADALTLLAEHPPLRERLRLRTAPSIITPHVGEFTRLGYSLSADRVTAARAAAADCGAIVVLKGASSVIAEPAGDVLVDLMGSPALATAGTGDALAGIVGAVAARAGKRTCAEAVAAGVYLHGLAGRIAGRGGRPTTAWDVVTAVPDAVAEIRR